MMYTKKTAKYVGKHVHNRGLNLAQEADRDLENVLRRSGFFRGQIAKSQFGTRNPSMENFIGKWNNMNNSRKGRFNPYLGSFRKDLIRAAS